MAGKKKYRVELNLEERNELKELLKKDRLGQEKRTRIQILLKADEGADGENWTDKKISEAFDVSLRKVERTRECLVEEGFEAAVNRKAPSRSREKKLDGEKEAHLIAICCSEAPEGRASWTLRLLADKMVKLEHVDCISRETIRQTLKKTNLSLGKKSSGVSRKKKTRPLFAKWKKF